MTRRGTYKYICEECSDENWLSTKDRSSHFRPKCISCGCPYLVLSSGSNGHNKIVEASDAAKGCIDRMNKKMGKNKC